jgi:hypothetical protein
MTIIKQENTKAIILCLPFSRRETMKKDLLPLKIQVQDTSKIS